MSKKYYNEFADKLWNAYVSKETISTLTDIEKDMTLDDAYRIQLLTVDKAVQSGYKIVGKKIGLTSKAMQQQFGIDVPDYGHLYENMIFDEEVRISLSDFHKPKIETEITFILGEDLKGPGISLTDVLKATEGIISSFEIIDSRINNWKIKVEDSVSDNASAAGITLGSKMLKVNEVDLKHIGLVLQKNGEIIHTAAGAAVMGHPAQSVAWLANKLGQYNVGLKKGEIILSGSLTPAIDIKPGDVFLATFDKLGPVKAMFKE
jgi:2-keto-4-pentenoate hydratase